MIDWLVHHGEILSLKGDSYRLRDKDLGPRPGRRRLNPPAPPRRAVAPCSRQEDDARGLTTGDPGVFPDRTHTG